MLAEKICPLLSLPHHRTVSVDCEKTQEMIVDQMNAWDNEDCGTQPGDTTPNGQKCLYKVLYIYYKNTFFPSAEWGQFMITIMHKNLFV